MSKLSELKEKAENYKKSLLKRRKENYHFARSLGFSPEEARILASYSRNRIIGIAREGQKET